jgi:hypothetical protein
MRLLDRFALNVPYLFLKRIPYLWPVVIVFWIWPPVIFSWILFAMIFASLILIIWQRRAWAAKNIRKYQQDHAPVYRDHPKMPLNLQLRNLVIVAVGSGLLGRFLQGSLDLSFWQWFFLASGFTLLYMDHRVFGTTTDYILTDTGLGLRYTPGHVEYRMFFSYQDIKQAQRVQVPKEKPILWTQVTPTRNVETGILLTPSNRNGFTNQIKGEILLAPTDIDAFLKHFPSHLIKKGT